MKALWVTVITVAAVAAGVGTLPVDGANNAAKVAKADKKAAGPKAVPLPAQVEKVDGLALTVMTRPLMGPDGLIPAAEKTYLTTDSTVVQVNGENKTLADLQKGEMVRLVLSDDGKTATRVEGHVVTPADRAARKAKKNAVAAGATGGAGAGGAGTAVGAVGAN
jgi:hypothetical protein